MENTPVPTTSVQPQQLVCPTCATTTASTSFFCPHCGRKLREAELSTSVFRQISIYTAALLLPPTGLFIGIRYLRQTNQKAVAVGFASIILTVVSIIVSVALALQLYNSLSAVLVGSGGLNGTQQNTPEYIKNIGL